MTCEPWSKIIILLLLLLLLIIILIMLIIIIILVIYYNHYCCNNKIDFSRNLKYTLTLCSQDLNVNSPYHLLYISYFLIDSKRFPKCSRTRSLFPGLSSCGNAKIKFWDIAQNAIVFRDMYLQCPFNQRAA